MSDIKKLFIKEKAQKPLSSRSVKKHGEDTESERYVDARIEDRERFLTHVRFHPVSASNFAKYGSAEKYYEDSISRIQDQYPYDGTLAEKVNWELSSSQLDLYIFKNMYPRTNGYINLCSTTDGWGSLNGSITSNYGLPSDIEYVQVKGGPHSGSAKTLVEKFYTHKPGVGSNYYETNSDLETKSGGAVGLGSRESNLKTKLDDGVTVEFWLKKAAFDASKTVKEVVFDLWNGNTVATGDYGRLLIELNSSASASPFRLTCLSGSTGYTDTTVGTGVTKSSLQNWAHYAFTFKNDGTKIRTRLYVNGTLDDEKLLGTNILEITGALVANIGALRASPVSGVSLTQGAGKLSASLDEFRFWKTERDHKKVGRYWNHQVGGGTNTDIANTTLGVYYKFNEGITGVTEHDSTVLDYSGRISNGVWIGYPGSTARATGSAMVESTASATEFRDPIIYPIHPSVSDLTYNLKTSGSTWDKNNNNLIYNTMPAWIFEYQEKRGAQDLENLVQIMASYFDTLHMQISNINRLKDNIYPSASLKPLPFANKLIEHYGMPASELFSNADVLAKILSRSESKKFELELHDTRNLIYRNIYNNLVNIYKEKGTEKAFRNLIRCFGVDEELIKLNLYGDNVTYKLEDHYKAKAKVRRYANFNDTSLFGATVYQYAESGNTNSVSYISGSKSIDKEAHFGATMETEVFFPKKPEKNKPGYFRTEFTESSLFGMHTVGSDASSYAFQNPDPANFHVLFVRTEEESPHGYFKLTSSATTVSGLESPITTLTSSVFQDVYDNEKWNFAVRIKPDNYPITDGIYTGKQHAATATFVFNDKPLETTTITIVDYEGTSATFEIDNEADGVVSGNTAVNNIAGSGGGGAGTATDLIAKINAHSTLDIVASAGAGATGEVLLTQGTYGAAGNTTISFSNYSNWNSSTVATLPTAFTGGASESYTLEFRGINNTLDTTENQFSLTASLSELAAQNFMSSSKRIFVGAHRTNFTGAVLNYSDVEISAVRYWPTYIDDTVFVAHAKDVESYGTKNPSKNITLLHSETENIRVPEAKTLALNWDFETLSTSDTSGQFTVIDASSGSSTSTDYGWFGDIINKQHTARGDKFPADSVKAIKKRYVNSAKQQLPETIYSSDMISIRTADDDLFTRDHRPVKFYFAIEKSMYQTISEEILNMFGTIVDFNNLIGAPVNRYRQEYKSLEKLRQLFFERVSNTADLDKYIEFYKWIDHSINEMLYALIPASADTSRGLQTTVESHVLERNKYWNKFPTIEMKSDPPTAGLFGINELLYNWKYSHAPVTDTTNQLANCPWWYERAERDDATTSGDSEVDSDRETIRKITGRHRDESRKVTTLDGTSYSGSAFAVSRFTKPYRLNLDRPKEIHGGTNFVDTKKVDIARTAIHPFGKNNDIGFPVNVVLFDDIYVNKSAKHIADSDPTRRVSGRAEPICTDGLDSEWPHNKYRYDFKARMLRDYGQDPWYGGAHPPDYLTTMKGEFVAPFSLYYTTVKSTFQKRIHEAFHSNVAVTNLHADSYGSRNEEPMQGPFTFAHVGGRQHRHIDLNTGVDNFNNRAEAWKLLPGPSSTEAGDSSPYSPDPLMLGLVGPDYPFPPLGAPSPGTCASGFRPIDRPRAIYLRNCSAKRPLNIQNIKYTPNTTEIGGETLATGSVLIMGNYKNEYEIVQAHGRKSNNRALVESEGITLVSGSCLYVSDVSGTLKHDRGRSEHVIASRFSAPGGPSQAGDQDGGFGLDVETAQYSVYNTMNYRNSLVRGMGRWPNGVRELLTNHTKQFGYYSDQMNISNGAAAENISSASVNALDYTGKANFHKTNRNTGYRIDGLNPSCVYSQSDFNRKALEWTKAGGAGDCVFRGYVTIGLQDNPSVGRKIDELQIKFNDYIDDDGNLKNNVENQGEAPAAGTIREAQNDTRLTGPGSGGLAGSYGAGKLKDRRGQRSVNAFSLNAFLPEWSVSIWTWPNVLTGEEDGECERGIFSLGSGVLSQTLNNAAGNSLTVTASRHVYLDQDNKVVVEVPFLTRSVPQDTNPHHDNQINAAGGQVTWSFTCGKWRSTNAVTEGQWSNVIVAHNCFRINTDGTPQGPDIYIDGTKETIVTVTAVPINSVPVSPVGDSYIGRTSPCGTDTIYYWYGYLDECSIWPYELSQDDVTIIASDPNPFNLEDHPSFGKCAMWYRFGDGSSPDGAYNDAVDGTGIPTLTNRFWDMAPPAGRINSWPSSDFAADTFLNVSHEQSTANKQLPGETVVKEHCTYPTSSYYDNWYITHEIPRAGAQYLWMSASCERDLHGTAIDANGHAIWHHLHPSGKVPAQPFVEASERTGSAYVPAIKFVTGSSFGSAVGSWGGSYGRKFGLNLNATNSGSLVYTPFNLNLHTYEPVTGSDNNLGWPLFQPASYESAEGSPASNTNTSIVRYLNDIFVAGGIPASTEGNAALFNTILLSRQGPYGWPSWKQIRGGEHPVALHHKKNNTLTIVDGAIERTIVEATSSKNVIGLPRGNGFRAYSEPPIVYNRFMTHVLNSRTVVQHTYRNNMCMYSNQEINNRLGLTENIPTMYSTMVEEYTKALTRATKVPSVSFNYLAYSEGVYPKEVNRYSNTVRTRKNFQFSWNSRRSERGVTFSPDNWLNDDGVTTPISNKRYVVHPQSITTFKNSQNYPKSDSDGGFKFDSVAIDSKYLYSTWPLDATDDGAYMGPSKTGPDEMWPINMPDSPTAQDKWNNSAVNPNLKTSGSGELQNYHVQLRGKTYYGSAVNYDQLVPGAQYHRRHTIETTGSADQWRYGVRGMSVVAPYNAVGTAPRKFTMSGSSLDWFLHTEAGTHDGWEVFGGETTWEVPAQSGKYPFYDSYEEYASEDLRLKGKEYSIIPEFKISEHIPFYMLQKGGDFLAENTASLSLTGSSYDNSGLEDFYKVYSHSDFMKKFDIVDTDHEVFGGPTQIELKCSAYLKLLPYDGFYPAQRTTQLASLFSQSFGPNMYQIDSNIDKTLTIGPSGQTTSPAGGTTGQRVQAAEWSVYMRPFFAPGIMFNSIKSGLAVDYPIMTGSYKVHKDPVIKGVNRGHTAEAASANSSGTGMAYNAAYDHTASGYYIAEPRFHHRIPFEAIINPQQYILDLPVTNMEPHPSGSLYLPLTAAVSSPSSDLYRMAANNFFAEVPEFFLQGGGFSAIASLPENHDLFGQVTEADITSDRKFGALVKIRKSVNKDQNFNRLSSSVRSEYHYRNGQFNMERLGTDNPVPHPWSLSEPTINMYSRPSAFGPPTIGFWGSNAGFNMPYTPPYYDGGAWAYLEFTPSKGSAKYTLDEILEGTEIMYTRAGRQKAKQDPSINSGLGGTSQVEHNQHVPNWPWSRPIDLDRSAHAKDKELKNGNDNIIAKVQNFFDPYPQGRDLIDENAMQISASINLMQKATQKSAEYSAITGQAITVSDDPQSDLTSWVIQTKFETPILNFMKSGSTGRSFAKESSAYGMWHQYGEYPTDSDTGVFLEVVDVPYNFLRMGLAKSHDEAKSIGSLADLVGFDTSPVKLGKPASSKTISEAIVAVPFIEKDGERHFFEIARTTVDEAHSRVLGNPPKSPREGADFVPGESIIDMVEKMDKFVFPPKMDFLTNKDVQPFAMYIFEFSVILSQQDLTDIWQNVLPDIGRTFEHQSATISHPLLATEFMGYDAQVTGKKIQNKLQWMVFKVKQKAQKNYFDKVVGKSRTAYEGVLSNYVTVRDSTSSKLVPMDYTYNWPYDYFSLVELAKVDATVEYGEDPTSLMERAKLDPSSVGLTNLLEGFPETED